MQLFPGCFVSNKVLLYLKRNTLTSYAVPDLDIIDQCSLAISGTPQRIVPVVDYLLLAIATSEAVYFWDIKSNSLLPTKIEVGGPDVDVAIEEGEDDAYFLLVSTKTRLSKIDITALVAAWKGDKNYLISFLEVLSIPWAGTPGILSPTGRHWMTVRPQEVASYTNGFLLSCFDSTGERCWRHEIDHRPTAVAFSSDGYNFAYRVEGTIRVGDVYQCYMDAMGAADRNVLWSTSDPYCTVTEEDPICVGRNGEWVATGGPESPLVRFDDPRTVRVAPAHLPSSGVTRAPILINQKGRYIAYQDARCGLNIIPSS